MAIRRVLLALLAAFLLLAVTPISFADSHARIVRLSDIEGSVQIDRNTGQGFEKAIMNMPITQGVRLETGSSGRAEVEFENGTVLRLAANSSVEFTDLTLRSEGQRATDVHVTDGTVYVNYKRKGGDEFRLDAANQGLNLDHDVHFRLRLDGGQAEVAVLKGELEVPHGSEMARVKKDETLNFDLNDPARNTLAKGISSFGDDQWDSERTNYNTQYASNYNRSQYPYQYGYSDLAYYGGFFNAPGYGNLWRPFGVSAMWDPFGDGAWAYYPSGGYMWVSSYPWGWMPYRYGQWVYVPTYGWAWQPGGWNSWNSYPVVVNAPPSWHHPVAPPVTGGGGSTVIVGNPIFTRPARPVHGAAGNAAVSGGVSSPASGSVDRPGRPTATTSGSAAPTTSGTDRPSRSVTPPTGAAPAPGTQGTANSGRPARGTTATPPPAAHPTPAPRPVTPARTSTTSSHSSGTSTGGMHSSGMSSGSHASSSASRPAATPRH